ncbi:MAG: FG-GAP repeat protein [Polyangiaceae bacterium]
MRRLTTLSVLFAGVACSWTRFDELEEHASVLVLEQPSGMVGFGSSLTSLADANRVLVLVAGAPKAGNGAAVFQVGNGQEPNLDAFDIGQCSTNDCALARGVAALPLARTPSGASKSACWVTGFEKLSPPALSVACTETGQQRYIYALDLPFTADADADQLTLASESLPPVGTAAFATALIAGVRDSTGSVGRAAAFAPSSSTAIELVPPTSVDGFAAAVAVLRAPSSRYFLVGAPVAQQLWVFDEAGQSLGCLHGGEGFARSLATGDVDGDGKDDLALAEGDHVLVLPGARITSLTGSCREVEPADVMVSLKCRNSSDVGGCASGFGDAIAIGDIDGNGDGEVAVGAPGASVRGESAAGAVFVYDVDLARPNPEFVTEERFIASSGSGDRLGAAVTFAPQKDRQLLIAGAPAAGKVAIFYCSKLLPAGRRGSRCE